VTTHSKFLNESCLNTRFVPILYLEKIKSIFQIKFNLDMFDKITLKKHYCEKRATQSDVPLSNHQSVSRASPLVPPTYPFPIDNVNYEL
jgi:hypothetical protein